MPSKKRPLPPAKSLTGQHRAAAAISSPTQSTPHGNESLYERDEAERNHRWMQGVAQGTHWPFPLG
jgi:hypothetical protein